MALVAESIHFIARTSGTGQAVSLAVENQFDLLEIRTILSDRPLVEILRAWLQCFRLPLQQRGNPHQDWALIKVSEVLYCEGEEVDGLTPPLVLKRFAPWLQPS